MVRRDIVEEVVMCQGLVVEEVHEDGVGVYELGGNERVVEVIYYHGFVVYPDDAVNLKFLSILSILASRINPECSQIEFPEVKVGNSVHIAILKLTNIVYLDILMGIATDPLHKYLLRSPDIKHLNKEFVLVTLGKSDDFRRIVTDLTSDDRISGLNVCRSQQVLEYRGVVLEARIWLHVLRLALRYNTDDPRHSFPLILQLLILEIVLRYVGVGIRKVGVPPLFVHLGIV